MSSQLSIDKATKIQYNPDNINPNAKKSVGIDPGFGPSNFAIVATQLVDGKIQSSMRKNTKEMKLVFQK
jgi:hypothetical protein